MNYLVRFQKKKTLDLNAVSRIQVELKVTIATIADYQCSNNT